ncbi:UDP-glucuronic acid dehydrogenase [Shewanella sp. 4_MG-2023]|uniref:UDP-glucuronic acid dehydrogenase n=1 Tax=Shewanella sp. 4_MG-2023 TaxID=3062652 RepID=UPI0026E1F53E|nr:UDP-glucuronic acid dehydrogenase [Shewanella sp. 4_MG-2023]MDO6678418.1 UDP-glucuronic acid dehydrogenase [Shewanella sp. 4_MG-2023]
MKITVICSNPKHPVYKYLENWMQQNSQTYDIALLTTVKDIKMAGDILFLLSCSEIVRKSIRNLFSYSLVLHASDLPEGKGWSPHIWDVVNGKNTLTLSLLNAEDRVDSGDIWQKKIIKLQGNELYDEINHKLFKAELELMSWACENIENAIATPQKSDVASYHRKRTPEDSKLDVNQSIISQFNLLRVCDPQRFPAYIEINNQRYNIRLEKSDDK